MSVKTDFDGPPAMDDEIEAMPTIQSLRPRRRPWLILAGVALSATCGVVAAMLYLTADERTSVLALGQDVAYGQELTEADLVTVRVALDPAVESVPADQVSTIVGRPAAADLHEGQLLTAHSVADELSPAPGAQLVAVPLQPSQIPVQGLRQGDSVEIVSTPSQGDEAPDGPPSAIPAEVVRVGPPDAQGVSVVDVEVAATDGATLAARVATGEIALVLNAAGED